MCDALRAAGIEVWFDQSELRGGDAWDQKIRQQIRECALFVPIISANTQSRLEGYFRREWRLAVDRTHDMADGKPFLVPVAIDDTPDNERACARGISRRAVDAPAGGRDLGGIRRTRATSAERRDADPGGVRALNALPRGAIEAARRRTNALRIGAIVVALGYFAFGWWRGRHEEEAVPPPPPVTPGAATKNASPAGVDEKSIAVLPFVDMSEKHDQEYFSDGLAEELLNLLSKVPDLQVIARTSSFSFKGTADDIADDREEAVGRAHSRRQRAQIGPAHAHHHTAGARGQRLRRCGRRPTTATSKTSSRCRTTSRASWSRS